MTHAYPTAPGPTGANRFTAFPALTGLRLDAGDLHALASQGFVAVEHRGSRTYFKLRYRRDGRQMVRYVGGADQAAAVRAELSRLQADTQLARERADISRRTMQFLREAKATLAPLLPARGLAFHGFCIRRPRIRHHETSVV